MTIFFLHDFFSSTKVILLKVGETIQKIFALIPCYNVEKYCGPVIVETVSLVDRLILVNDGSTDGTLPILEDAARNYPKKIQLIDFAKNQGKGAALLTGIQEALHGPHFDVLVTLDSDGQHLPSEIKKMVKQVEGGAEFVMGCRNFDLMPLRSRFGNELITFLLHLVFPMAPRETQSGFRAFSRKFCEKIANEVSGSRYEMEFQCLLLALKDKAKMEQCPIKTIYLDKNRSTHYSSLPDSYRIIKVLSRYWRSGKI